MALIKVTEEFQAWFDSLSGRERREVNRVINLLESLGVALAYPHSSALEGARYSLRELRPKRGDSPLRVIYAFDPLREVLLLLGGDKSNDKRFYERIIPKAERIWEKHLKDLEEDDDP